MAIFLLLPPTFKEFYLEVAEKSWKMLLEDVRGNWKGDTDPKNYASLAVSQMELNNFQENVSDQEIEKIFNKEIRTTRLDSLIYINDSSGESYSLKNCVFLYGKRGDKRKIFDELVWELAHELCHSFGAGHSFEGIMSRPFSPNEEFYLDDQAKLTLQYAAFYLEKDLAALKELYTDYLTNTAMKKSENKLILKMDCLRSGPKFIYFLDMEDKYEEIFSYETEKKSGFTLETGKNVKRIIFIFFDGNREFISLPRN